MRSFQQLVVLLFATLFAFALAQESDSYDATIYITSTVYRVNTVTMSGASPTGSVANSTSTITATHPAYTPIYSAGNSTMVSSTGAPPSSTSPPPFEGAASHLSINAIVVALAAGVGYLAL